MNLARTEPRLRTACFQNSAERSTDSSSIIVQPALPDARPGSDRPLRSGREGILLAVVIFRGLLSFSVFVCAGAGWARAEAPAVARPAAVVVEDFRKNIKPLLEKHCYDCHGDGESKGKLAFDKLGSDTEMLAKSDVWVAVLKNVRAGLMPARGPRLPADDAARLVHWIKAGALGLDPARPNPGRATLRRLNRAEYRNTIRDLIGVDFDTTKEFPTDDSGFGFDNIADALTVSPLLLEKYVNAARAIVEQAVPTVPRIPMEKQLDAPALSAGNEPSMVSKAGQLILPYYKAAAPTHALQVEKSGKHRLTLNVAAADNFRDNIFDYNKCRLVIKVDGDVVLEREFSRENNRLFPLEFERVLKAGANVLTFEVVPLEPAQPQTRALRLRIEGLTVRGPLEPGHWIAPKDYAKFFPKPVPSDPKERLAYARELLGKFAARAYRHPVDEATLERLAGLAQSVDKTPGQTFEAGIAHAMVAVLASPRFLFRDEGVEALPPGDTDPLVDEFALASRLSYFLWSTMPDEELLTLAAAGKLRAGLDAQVRRMLADARSAALVANFAGQWLGARDIPAVTINAQAVLDREAVAGVPVKSGRGGPPGALTPELRLAMRQETEQFFAHIMRQNRPLTEFIDSDYTFLNARLASHYGIPDIAGDELRLVQLPPDHPRGGVLTHGTVLAVTSNPTRTSPVKRGLFVLNNILGTPVPPPPPDIPDLDVAAKTAATTDRQPTLRESLAIHREKAACASCHDRMDPLGLALENFNALGLFRQEEHSQKIDPSGKLITGEKFADVRELKRVLAVERREDFHRCLTEKMLTYAIGRGLEPSDITTVDAIVARIHKEDGRFHALLSGIIESAPFQKRRHQPGDAGNTAANVAPQ
ncbi:MAG: DUF1592 domain-containing protein [Verrucomicrobia bacterium]|nr:MAG: DUF1592 domain-containing protein [Verrucomicrobiota bacterium]